MRTNTLAIATCLLVVSEVAFCGGFEPVSMWSGKWSAMSGCAVAAVDDADALVFNPAGLVETQGKQISANLSPIIARLSGVIRQDSSSAESGKTLDSKTAVTPSMGMLYKQSMGENIALGFGVYAVAGLGSEYKNIDYSSLNSGFNELRPSAQGHLSDVEVSIGASVKLNKNWNIGGAWRMAIVEGELSSVAVALDSILVNVELKDLEDKQYDGIRLGIQYKSDDEKWGFGLAWRNAMKFELKGKSSGFYDHAALPKAPLENGGDVIVKSALPQMISIGAYLKLSEKYTITTEIRWIEYSMNKQFDISGQALNLNTGFFEVDVISDVQLNWKNQTSYHLGSQYRLHSGWHLRNGLSIASQVTPDDDANALFIAPGIGYSLAMGAGKQYMNGKLEFDMAMDYSQTSGHGKTTLDKTGLLSRTSGKFTSEALVFHTTVKYNF